MNRLCHQVFPSSSSTSFPYLLLLYTSQFFVSRFVCICAHICVRVFFMFQLLDWLGRVGPTSSLFRRQLLPLKMETPIKAWEGNKCICKHHTVHIEILWNPNIYIYWSNRVCTCVQIIFVFLLCLHKTKIMKNETHWVICPFAEIMKNVLNSHTTDM